MILTELKQYIDQQGSVSRKELADKFSLSEDGVDAMLEMWLKKGKVSKMVDINSKKAITGVRYRSVMTNDIQLTVIS